MATRVLASTGVMSAFDVQAMNWQILVAQTQSTQPAVQKCGDTVVQRTLLPSPDVSSGLAVTAQNPSLASAVVSLSETTPSLQSSGNMVPQNQPPLAVVTPSTSAISSSNNVVAQGQLPVPVVIQNSSTQAIHSSGKSQTQPSLAAAVPQTSSTQAMYGPAKILPQNQPQLAAANPQIPSTSAINNTGNMVAQSQSPSLAAVSQTASTPSIPGSSNMLPQNQSALSGAVNQTSLTPTLQIFDDMPPQTGLQTPPPIIISDNASTQPVQSLLNTQSQNQLPMLTVFQSDFNRSSHSGVMPTHSQPSSTSVSQTAPSEMNMAPQSLALTYSTSGNFSMPSYPNFAHMFSQPFSGPEFSLDESDTYALNGLLDTFLYTTKVKVL